jgi:putative SOS response-associated peptidase YedK
LHISDLGELRPRLGVQRILVESWRPRYNVAPTQAMPVVLVQGGERVLQTLHYGLVPSWAKDAKGASRLINARIETVATLPSFRRALRARRCVVPATGYYEWRAEPGRSKKQPMWIHAQDGTILALAGIAESWRTPNGDILETFAILTTQAEGALALIHDRMPVQLDDAEVNRWLEPGPLAGSVLGEIVRSAARVEHMAAIEVDHRVNSPRIDDPTCIAPREVHAGGPQTGPQLRLFD